METPKYSGLTESFDLLKQRVDDRALLRPVEPFTAKESTPAAVKKRAQRAIRDFAYFDRTYFAPEQYQNYAEPSDYHTAIRLDTITPGVTVHAGPRSCGKTVTAKKSYVHQLLVGKIHMLGLLSYTLPNAQNITRDIAALIFTNDRIVHDFGIDFLEANSDQFAFRVNCKYVKSKKIRYGAAFSEGRSVRGYSRIFSRPEAIYADDLETLATPIGGEHTARRILMLEEAFASCGGDTPHMFCAGNNFDVRGYIAQLLKEQEDGILGEKASWRIKIHKAWDNGKSIWEAKYPAKTEDEMRAMVKARTITDWNANYQQRPTPPEGHVFKRQFLAFWDKYPSDAKGVIYTDQNLALKSKGDTTAIVRMTYSPKTEFIYISARCRSFADPNELLDATLAMRAPRITSIGFDGNVSQESHWKSHIRAWCRERKTLFPTAHFLRYDVDALATNFQMVYAEGRVLFDPAMMHTEEGQAFFDQFFAFISKKQKRKDDAPDAAICAYQFLTSKNLHRKGGTTEYSTATYHEEEY